MQLATGRPVRSAALAAMVGLLGLFALHAMPGALASLFGERVQRASIVERANSPKGC
jgi:hypothetical protein